MIVNKIAAEIRAKNVSIHMMRQAVGTPPVSRQGPGKREESVTFGCLSWTKRSDLNRISVWTLERQ